jgi:hypothetical protein
MSEEFPTSDASIMTLGRYDLVGELLPYIRLRTQSKKGGGRDFKERE